MGYLRSVPVGLLVKDEDGRIPSELAALLSGVLRDYAANWELVEEFPESPPHTGRVRVYRHIGYESPIDPKIRVDMGNHFGRAFANDDSE
jgi:hypothetical protein